MAYYLLGQYVYYCLYLRNLHRKLWFRVLTLGSLFLTSKEACLSFWATPVFLLGKWHFLRWFHFSAFLQAFSHPLDSLNCSMSFLYTSHHVWSYRVRQILREFVSYKHPHLLQPGYACHWPCFTPWWAFSEPQNWVLCFWIITTESQILWGIDKLSINNSLEGPQLYFQ